MKIIAYKNVFKRDNPKEFDFKTFIDNPNEILGEFSNTSLDIFEEIKQEHNKEERNRKKRELLPAVDLSLSGVLSIDIDNISQNEIKKQQIIQKLKKIPSCLCVKESVSGNLVSFFKYNCQIDKYQFLYYKLYLELTLMLSVNIDFLPEIGRLRYISNGETYHYNDDSEVITEYIEVDNIPYVNTTTPKDKARRIIFGSK